MLILKASHEKVSTHLLFQADFRVCGLTQPMLRHVNVTPVTEKYNPQLPSKSKERWAPPRNNSGHKGVDVHPAGPTELQTALQKNPHGERQRDTALQGEQ